MLRRRLRHAAEQAVSRGPPKDPSVSTTATAPEPPVSVASEVLNNSMLRLSSSRSIMMSLISRAVSQETTSPARHLAQFDPIGHVEHAVEDAEAGVADVENRRAGPDAQFRRHPARGRRLELLAAHPA